MRGGEVNGSTSVGKAECFVCRFVGKKLHLEMNWSWTPVISPWQPFFSLGLKGLYWPYELEQKL